MTDSCFPPGLLGVDAAIEKLVAIGRQVTPAQMTLSLTAAAGFVLAEEVFAPLDVPPEANSAMDGFAFCLADLPPSGELPVSQRIPAGTVPAALIPGTAARIFTGAILPAGADTVVMQEQCEYADTHVRVVKRPARGANVRPAGQDVVRGQRLLARGDRLSPASLGLAASAGFDSLTVFRPLRVAVLCTGDELLEPGEAWRPGAIYNSNRPLLTALLRGWGFDVLDLGRVDDSLDGTLAALDRAVASGADVIVSTGGVSVGEEDHVKRALQQRGALDFWKVAIKPGKPVAVGEIAGTPFIGLPGNPQSVFVTALVLARPFLLSRQGQARVLPPVFDVAAGFARARPADRREYLRVRYERMDSVARLVPHPQQSSGALMSAVWAHGFALVESGTSLAEGDPVPFLPL
ncbi:MAG TPA: gephyrin-like molybdotransferase Glp, partial [Moraxellaceae bacterium]|nr:gephyrin-like molybdotransferase Glp [Moraxellaceae bacterium]